MNQIGSAVTDEGCCAGERRALLEELHRWAGARRFNPPWWLRQPDLQTSWYVIREIAAGVRDRRISTRQIWKYIEGQEKDYPAACGGSASSGPSAFPVATGQADHLPRLPTQSVELPFEEDG
ncbi:MAG: hypothetical protein HYX74_04645, partial [Acidobacteria bacterium]|nr:hypothetical protein [Acidobacteriota bacterium]